MKECEFCGGTGAALFYDTYFCEECISRFEAGTLCCRICGEYITQEEFDNAMRCKDCLEAGVDEW